TNQYRLFARVASGKKDGLRSVIDAGVSGDAIDQLYSDMGGFGDWSTQNSMSKAEKHFGLSMTHPFGVYANMSYDEETNGYPFLIQPLEGNDNLNTSSYIRINLGVRKQLTPTTGFNANIVYGKFHQLHDYDTQLFPDAWEIQRTQCRIFSLNLALFLTTPSKKLDVTIGSNYSMAFDANTVYDLPQFGLSNGYAGLLDPIITRSLYFQGKWHLTKNFIVVAGVRLEQGLKYEMLVETNAGMQYVDPENYYDYPVFKGTGFYDNEKVNIIPRLAVIRTLGKRHVLKF
ncbi:MAG: TonB-dependent receptor, partial [bacterium]|nr:TonB-dependent receptor [bacterium]